MTTGPYVLSGLASAASFGAGDFAGGVATRRTSGLVVAAGSQLTGCVLMLLLIAAVHPPAPGPAAIGLGLAAGLAGATGIASLYRALATGAMGLVAAVSGAGTVVVPLLASLLVLGGAISGIQLGGVACVIAAVLAASGAARTGASRHAIGLALLAALAFGLWYVLLDRAASAEGLWALTSSRLSGTAFMLLLAGLRRGPLPGRRTVPLVAASGAFDVTGNALFVIARGGLPVGLAAALSGIYPLVTMLLARTILGERLPRLGLAGVGLAIAGIVLISIG
jgi:drug/metabolite transporter (DMT)-like permease